MIPTDRATLESEIRTAFSGTVLGNGVSLGHARVRDRSGEGFSDEELASLIPDNEVTDNWPNVPLEQLDNDLCIGHLDAEGFRYYIPALMLSVLSHYDPAGERVSSTIFALDRPSGGRQSWYDMLNEAQRRAIAHFLEALPGLLPLRRHDVEDVLRALRNHWSQYL